MLTPFLVKVWSPYSFFGQGMESLLLTPFLVKVWSPYSSLLFWSRHECLTPSLFCLEHEEAYAFWGLTMDGLRPHGGVSIALRLLVVGGSFTALLRAVHHLHLSGKWKTLLKMLLVPLDSSINRGTYSTSRLANSQRV